MRLLSKLKLIIVLICFQLSLTGCFTNDVDTRSTSKLSTLSQVDYEEWQTFGIIFPMADPAYEQITENAERIAQDNFIKLLVAAPDEANLEQQIRIMESMIRQNVSGIAISPVDGDALIPAINKAIEKNIPVICFESDSPNSKRLAYIGSNNIETGQRLGKAVNELLNGTGMIIVGTGMSDMLSLKQRLEGLLDYLNNETKIEVLEVAYNEGKKDVAVSKLEEAINDHPHFSAFLSLDSISSSASVLIWKATGMNRYVLSVGSTHESETALNNGQIHTIISQNEHIWGEQIIYVLLQASSEPGNLPTFIDMGISQMPSYTERKQ